MSETIKQSIGTPGIAVGRRHADGYPASSARFDWIITILAWWIVAGLFTDGWAHNSLGDSLETFFTPWHGLLYSGLGATGLALVASAVRNVARGYGWTRSLPAGYMLSLIGFGLFAGGGVLDFIWHAAAGFEASVEALLSPPHLLLASGGVLIVGGPLRSAWLRPSNRDQSWASLLPALLSLLAVLSIFTFFAQFSNGFQHANVFTGPRPTEPSYYHDTTGVSYVLIPTALVMGFSLLALQRWSLPPGSLTLLIAGNAGLMFGMGVRYNSQNVPVLLAALAGGVIADVLYGILKPSAERVAALRVFAFAAPFGLFLLYFGTLILTAGIWWRIHMWLGAPFLAGVVGLGLSFLVRPPAYPGEPVEG